MARAISLWVVAMMVQSWNLSAQSTGSLTGVVRDTQAAVIVGAAVVAENVATGSTALPPQTKPASIFFRPYLSGYTVFQ